MTDTNILTLPDNSFLSFRHITGKKPFEILFMHGTLSDKNASKSLFLEDFCKRNDIGYIAFDFIGHGQSSGKYTDGTIGLWLDNALEVIDKIAKKPLIIVGSSMGGWIALLAALARPEQIIFVVGLAAAPDFTVDLWNSFSDQQKKDIQEKGIIYIPNGWTQEGDPWTKKLFDDAEKHLLFKDENQLNIQCPLTLIQGAKDDCVPVQTVFKIMKAVKTNDVKIVILKNSGHRLSEPDELTVLENELLAFIQKKGY